MAASGIALDDSIVTVYNEMKIRKTRSCMIMKIIGEKRVSLVDSETMGGVQQTQDGTPNISDENLNFDQLYKILESALTQPCYIVIDYPLKKEDGSGTVNSLVFISWVPDGSNIKEKMLYASTKEAVYKKLTGIQHKLEATDLSELLEIHTLKKK